MPNWVFNGLTIEGNPEDIKTLVEQMNKPYKQVHDSWNMETGQMEKKLVTYPNPVFAFHNIYNYIDDNVSEEVYHSQPPSTKASLDDMEAWHKEISELSQIDNTWYNWNVRNWGTKWDVAVNADDKYPDTYIEGPTENGENLVVYYNMHTAWSPPVPAVQKLSAQYPSLLFTLSYEEETGWGGEMEILRGEVISISEYENKCRDCDSDNTMEYCDNDCGEICSNCNWLGEADLDCVKECQTHKVYLDSEHVPDYRMEKA